MRDLRQLGLRSCGTQALPPPTAQQLSVVEQLVGKSLPESYVSFLSFCNRCYTERNWFSIETPWGQRGYLVAAFYHISAESDVSSAPSEVSWQYQHRGEGVPPGIVPIALTPLGDRIYLDLTEQGEGRVVLAQHGLPAWASGNLPADTEIVLYVASSFGAFLDLLQEQPEEE